MTNHHEIENILMSKVNGLALLSVMFSVVMNLLKYVDHFFAASSNILSGCVSLSALTYTVYRIYLLKKDNDNSTGKSN